MDLARSNYERVKFNVFTTGQAAWTLKKCNVVITEELC